MLVMLALAVLQQACCLGQEIEWASVCRYVVPLVFYAMHKRWTTKRPLKDEWPHRPLITDVGLQQVVVDDGVALAEVSGAQGWSGAELGRKFVMSHGVYAA